MSMIWPERPRPSDWSWKSDEPLRDWFWWHGPALRRLCLTVIGCTLFAMVGYVLGTWLFTPAPRIITRPATPAITPAPRLP